MFISETIVEPNQKEYPWYHCQFRRVATIDQCYTDDPVCIQEANEQFKRDKSDTLFFSVAKKKIKLQTNNFSFMVLMWWLSVYILAFY